MLTGEGRFGGLDHRFYGARISYHSAADWEFSSSVYSKIVSPKELSERRKRGSLSDRELWLATAVEHEVRHFHDSLLSTSWLTIFFLRNQSAINLRNLINHFPRLISLGNATCLPIPVQRWLQTSAADRRFATEAWARWTGEQEIFRPLPMPIQAAEGVTKALPVFWPDGWSSDLADTELWQLADAFHHAVKGYRRIAEINSSHPSKNFGEIKPKHIYELSALLVQLAAAHKSIDEESPKALWLSLRERAAREYGDPLLWFLSYFMSRDGGTALNMLRTGSAVALWALIGPPDLPNDEQGNERSQRELDFSSPAFRMAFALDALENSPIPEGGSEAILSSLDEKAGTMGYRESLGWMNRILKRKAEQYEAIAEEHKSAELDVVSGLTRFFSMQREQMTARFLASPDDYIDPSSYFDRMNDYPEVPLRYDFTGREFPVKYVGKENERILCGAFETITGTDGATYVKSGVTQVPKGLSPHLLYDYEQIQIFTDYNITGIAPREQAHQFKDLWMKGGLRVVEC